MSKIDEIGLEYAHEHGGGLPLSAKEFCNALALWVEGKFNAGIPLDKIADLLKGSDTITLYNEGEQLEIHLNAEVLKDIQSSLKLPVSNPTEDELVGVDRTGQQIMIPVSQVGGGKLYRHNISFKGTNDDYYFFSYISSNPNPTQLPADDSDYMDTNPQAKGSLVTKQVFDSGISDKVDTNFPLGTFWGLGGNQYELMSYGGYSTEIDLFVNFSIGSFRDQVTEL